MKKPKIILSTKDLITQTLQSDPLKVNVLHDYDSFVDISGYKNLYKINKYGVIISCGGKSNHKEPILLKCSHDRDGYKRVYLSKNKIKNYYRICRLVAIAFVKNRNKKKYSVVNHLDENRDNDYYKNLEWTDCYGNWKHSEHSHVNKEIKVIRISVETKRQKVYKNLMDAARDIGINQGNITNCLRGRCKTVGGYIWKKYE